MLHQYNAQRSKAATYHGRRVGTIDVGTILYIQDRVCQYRGPVCRNPWIVEAWHNRTIGATRRGPDGKYTDSIVAGGHLATVRSLRDGRRQTVSDCSLLAASDMGLARA